MTAGKVGRAAVSGWFRAARLPVDMAVRVLPNGNEGPRNGAMLAIDRLEATMRDTVGGLLGDDDLRADAHRRRIAADERERALELRVVAEQKKRDADTHLSEVQDAARQRRQSAQRTARQRKQTTNNDRNERQRSTRQATAKQRQAVARARTEKTAAADTQAKRRRLQVLDHESGALDQETKALAASDEARRLRKAVSKTKSARKRNT